MSMIFLCIHIANATKVTKYHFIPMKLKKKVKFKILKFSVKSDCRGPEDFKAKISSCELIAMS